MPKIHATKLPTNPRRGESAAEELQQQEQVGSVGVMVIPDVLVCQ
ncbi:MAG: hypothetical protein ACUVQQ_03620 [Thermogutta sp.]